MKHILVLFFLLIISLSYAQTSKHIQASQIDKLSANYQTCLDSGINMYGCTVAFYSVMDSCLNVAYKQLYNKLNKDQQQALKKEELNWLKQRDQQFKTIEQTNTYDGRDGEMMMQQQKNDIVKKRVLLLIKKLDM